MHHLSSAGGFALRGVLAATLGGVALWDMVDRHNPAHCVVPALDGACVWAAPHTASQHFVTTLRPSRGHARVQHIVSTLTPDAVTGVACAVQGVMVGGTTQKALARSTLLSKPGHPDHLLLAASDEPTQTVGPDLHAPKPHCSAPIPIICSSVKSYSLQDGLFV